MTDEDIKKIAKATAIELAKILSRRNRDEISLVDVCTEFGISRQTVYRRVKYGLIPEPRKKGNKNFFNRAS